MYYLINFFKCVFVVLKGWKKFNCAEGRSKNEGFLCQNGHTMTLRVHGAGVKAKAVNCEACGGVLKNAVVHKSFFRCDKCDYNACLVCVVGRDVFYLFLITYSKIIYQIYENINNLINCTFFM